MARMETDVVREEGAASLRRRRVLLWLVPAVAFLAILGIATLKKGFIPQAGDPAPAFSAPLLDGTGTLSLADLDGRPVFVNFWASWCKPCADEAPMLSRAYAAYKDRIAFVGVDVHDARDDAIRFASDNGLTYPHVRDEDGRIYSDYGLTGQPESFFIDRDGVIVEHVNGPLDEDSLAQLLDVLVQRGATGS
jgi:cytochrome c biogenesis protein CcmG/thiol:disulfide interchange protein DsbE